MQKSEKILGGVMSQFTIAYDGEIIPNHVFQNLPMAQQYLENCGYTPISKTEWELTGIVATSRAQILKIRSQKGMEKSRKTIQY